MTQDMILHHFSESDPSIYQQLILMDEIVITPVLDHSTYFHKLLRSIISQQLSVKAADTIGRRFESLFDQQTPSPTQILEIQTEDLRSVGISGQKVKYMKDLADKVQTGHLHLTNLYKLSEEEVIAELTQVKGIGRWTAEMFLIFTLGRPDVFSFGDQGLKQAFRNLYQCELDATNPQVLAIIHRWQPYQSAAALALWHSLDNQPK